MGELTHDQDPLAVLTLALLLAGCGSAAGTSGGTTNAPKSGGTLILGENGQQPPSTRTATPVPTAR
ncbi:hypothetical protein [Nonomuraea jiangxiensis]|uniref:Uncharacterized protein n=1 Tax=Nonomuraea jiangxiensis TaxID=633440 RepID=A0A1G8RPP7_9ACTN|nr:hypothetical protein [Nonomuraea jiangxiensis]SDJ18882.1 hypothetical protein SAMN05421869_109142 [Nonomuraea jiangxiensis]